MGTSNFGTPKFRREKAKRFLNKGKLVQATRGHNLVLFLGPRLVQPYERLYHMKIQIDFVYAGDVPTQPFGADLGLR